MTSVAKNYTDFHNFPGALAEENTVYNFPILYSKTKANKIRYWALKIILVKATEVIYTVDWDPKKEHIQTINATHYDSKNKLPRDIIALIYNEQGIIGMKMTRHPPTKVLGGSPGLEGKANERNTFTQALITARGQYDKKINAGYTVDNQVKKKSDDLYFAMAAQPYDISRVEFPCYSQPKLDGVRCLMAPISGQSKLVKYSRDQNIWPGFDNFDEILFEPARAMNIILDGELYLHGKRLQEIVGVARNETKALNLQYYIFDVIPVKNLEMPFSERLNLLGELQNRIESRKQEEKQEEKSIIFVPTVQINNEAELNAKYSKYIADGFEGQMIRMAAAPYATSKYRETRSYGILKRKKKFTEEFKFVGISHGINGKQEGCFIGIFETKDGKQFNATPKGMTIQEMRDYYTEVNANLKKFIGKMATIEFEDISKDNKPLRPKFVVFREGNE